MGFDFREEWKERLVYREDGKEFTFTCGWGTTPGVVYVPAANAWNYVTPEWMHGRRDEIIERIQIHVGSRYVIHDHDEGSSNSARQWVTVFGAAPGDRGIAGQWVAALMEADETAPPDASWPETKRALFLADHPVGSGETPAEAVDELKQHTGRPDLRWGA